MAVPKKRKFLRYSVPKSVNTRLVCRERNRGFHVQAVFLRKVTRSYFFNQLELALFLNMGFFLSTLLRGLCHRDEGRRLIHNLPLLSIFLYRGLHSFSFGRSLLFFNKLGVYVKHEVSSSFKLPVGQKALVTQFGFEGGVSTLHIVLNGPQVAASEGIALQQGSAASTPKSGVRLRTNCVVAKVAVQKNKFGVTGRCRRILGWFRRVGGSLFRKNRSGTSSSTIKRAGFLSSVHGFLYKTGFGVYARATRSLAVDRFTKFFSPLSFHKKVQWKTVFKYYYWTWDPLWMRYRYRIYWAKKAMHQRLNRVLFEFFFRRLRALQVRRDEVLSRWHCTTLKADSSGVKLNLSSLELRSQLLGLVWVRTPLIYLSSFVESALVAVIARIKSQQTMRTQAAFVSVGVSFSYGRLFYLVVRQPMHARVYRGFNSLACSPQVNKVTAGKFSFADLKRLWSNPSKGGTSAKVSKVTSWKTRVSSRVLVLV